MSRELHTRAARPEDRGAILDLVERTFGSDGFLHRPDFWAWKHDRNPFGPSPTRVAEARGEIVALRTFLRWRFRWGGREEGRVREIEAVRAVDTATRSDWRGRGLFTRLTLELVRELRTESVGLVFNTPNRKSRPGYLAMGWRTVRHVPVWIRIRSPRAWPRSASDPVPADPGEPIETLLGHPGLPSLLRAMADGRSAGDDRYRTLRTVEYLRWRYGDIPGFAYRAVFDFSDTADRSAALIFRSRPRGDRRELDVAEILTSPGRGSAARAAGLLNRLVRDSRAHYLAACAPWPSPEARRLLRAGFVPVPWMGPRLVVRPLDLAPELPSPERWSTWHLGLGDLEIF